jgi:hypothetical protein
MVYKICISSNLRKYGAGDIDPTSTEGLACVPSINLKKLVDELLEGCDHYPRKEYRCIF